MNIKLLYSTMHIFNQSRLFSPGFYFYNWPSCYLAFLGSIALLLFAPLRYHCIIIILSKAPPLSVSLTTFPQCETFVASVRCFYYIRPWLSLLEDLGSLSYRTIVLLSTWNIDQFFLWDKSHCNYEILITSAMRP